MRLICLFLILIAGIIHGCKQEESKAVKIAAASNVQYALKEIAELFTKETGVSVNITTASSGMLTTQIRQGADFDIFLSANMFYPEILYKDGLAVEAPEIYAYGKLVLWSLNDNSEPGIEKLTSKTTDHIAIANPDLAPYGIAAVEALKHFGIYENIQSKLVFGENISQTNQFIYSGSADAGFTSKSVVMSPQMKGKGHFTEIDPAAYAPIKQGIVMLNNKNQNEFVQEFYSFLFSEKSGNILEQYGYLTVKNHE